MFRQFIAKQITRSQINKLKYNFSLIEEPNSELYETQLKQEFLSLYNKNGYEKIPGFATPEGTLEYSQLRGEGVIAKNHFKQPFDSELRLSSVGIGTYKGSPEERTDLLQFNAIVDSVLSGGVNVIDTAPNFRYMKSERTLGAALQYLIKSQKFKREHFFIASKAGFLPEDADNGHASVGIQKRLDLQNDDIVGTVHCLNPVFLEDQLNNSLQNIGLETLDLFYIQNASEAQLPLIGAQKFEDRLKKAFEFCEQAIQNNKIKNYGLATWVCFRAKQEEHGIYQSLEQIVELAEQVGGQNNGFKYVQVPINPIMPEAVFEDWQIRQDGTQDSLLAIAREKNLNIISSCPLLDGALLEVPMPTEVFKCKNLGAKHIQFTRSIPSKALLSTLVGMKSNRHVKKNLEVIQHEILDPLQFWEFFEPKHRVQIPERQA